MIRIFFSTSPMVVLRKVVITKLLVSGILFSTNFCIKKILVFKPLVSGIYLSTSPVFFSKFCLSVLY